MCGVTYVVVQSIVVSRVNYLNFFFPFGVKGMIFTSPPLRLVIPLGGGFVTYLGTVSELYGRLM